MPNIERLDISHDLIEEDSNIETDAIKLPIGADFLSNTFGNFCWSNNLATTWEYNNIGNKFQNNITTDLFTTNTSAISIKPAFMVCISSPASGTTTTTVTSASSTTTVKSAPSTTTVTPTPRTRPRPRPRPRTRTKPDQEQ